MPQKVLLDFLQCAYFFSGALKVNFIPKELRKVFKY